MTVRDETLRLERRRDRCTQMFGQFDDRLHLVPRAVADQDQRPLGRRDHSDGLRRHPGIGWAGREPDAAVGAAGFGPAGSDLHFVRQDQVANGSVEQRVLAGERHQLGVVRPGENGLGVSGHIGEGCGQVQVLESPSAEAR
jgi:hypothetical protein